jgi:hypothetical protein
MWIYDSSTLLKIPALTRRIHRKTDVILRVILKPPTGLAPVEGKR